MNPLYLKPSKCPIKDKLDNLKTAVKKSALINENKSRASQILESILNQYSSSQVSSIKTAVVNKK